MDPQFGGGMRDHLFINLPLLIMYNRTHMLPNYVKEILL
jgi:hypothetical protein